MATERLLVPINAGLDLLAYKLRRSPVHQPGLDSFEEDLVLLDTSLKVVRAFAPILEQKFHLILPPDLPICFDLERLHPRYWGVAYHHSIGIDRSPMARGTSEAERRWLSGHQHAIGFNLTLNRPYPKLQLNDVIRHELAHVVQRQLHDQQGRRTAAHGLEWCEIMRQLGVKYPAAERVMRKAQSDLTRVKQLYRQHKLRKEP